MSRNFTTHEGLQLHRIDKPQIGLMAGWGDFPLAVVKSMKANGYKVYCAGLRGHADPMLADICDGFTWCGLLRFGTSIRFFKKNHCSDAVMAGKVFKVQLLQPWRWLRFLPDWRTMTGLPRVLRRDGRDDTLLSWVVEEFARDGVRFQPATDYAPELLVKAGLLTRRRPTDAQRHDIQLGWSMAKEMGRLDIGQSVMVKDKAVIAVEAIEGTDECIRRAGALCRGGFTVVKVAKPQQDMRFDVPTVGLQTLQTMLDAGGKVLAIEADRTIILDQPSLIDFANRHGMVVVALQTDASGVPQLA